MANDDMWRPEFSVFLLIVDSMVEIRHDASRTSSKRRSQVRLGDRVYGTIRANATAKAAKAGLQEEARRKLERSSAAADAFFQ